MNIYKIAQTDIQYIGNVTFEGAHFVQFKIGNDYWAYRFKFPDGVDTVRKKAIYSPGKALDWAKKNNSDAFKTTRNFPMLGSIIREEGEEEGE